MDSTFVDDIKKKSSLVKFVVNTDTASDIISYLYKETERQKSEIEEIKKKLGETNRNDNNQDKYNQLSERINELVIEMNKKIDESDSNLNSLLKDRIKEIEFKTDVLFKRLQMGDKSPRSAFTDIYNQIRRLNYEIQSLRKNTSEFLGIEEDELTRMGTGRNNNLNQSNPNTDSESSRNIPSTPTSNKNSDLPSILISPSSNEASEKKKERISLQDITDQIKQLKEEMNQQKELSNKLNTSRISSRNNSGPKKKDKELLPKQKKNLKDAEIKPKAKNSDQKDADEPKIKDINKEEKETDEKDKILEKNTIKGKEKIERVEKIENEDKDNLKSDEFESLQQEIENLKQIINNQTEQLKVIQETSKTGQSSLDDYIQEILQSAMKCDSESQKLTNDYKNLQNLLINSLQEIKERMDSMANQFTDMATKEEVMAAFSEIFNPKTPQNGTSIGVSKCKCLACGRVKPSVVTTTDSNLAEILHYHPLASRIENFRPGAKVTVLNKEMPITSRTQKVPKDIVASRRPKSSRS